jgi:hypothetical protein
VAVVVVVAAAGGFAAREIYRPQAGQQVTTSITATSTTPLPPDKQPGARDVVGTQDAVGHPQYAAIRQLLQDHFDAINDRQYDKWRTTVTRDRAKTLPEPSWREDYRTTRDGSILIHRIDTSPDRRMRVLLGFTSTQRVEDAPPELPEPCIKWRIVLPLAKEDNKWKIDVGSEGASPQHDGCGTQVS